MQYFCSFITLIKQPQYWDHLPLDSWDNWLYTVFSSNKILKACSEICFVLLFIVAVHVCPQCHRVLFMCVCMYACMYSLRCSCVQLDEYDIPRNILPVKSDGSTFGIYDSRTPSTTLELSRVSPGPHLAVLKREGF